MGRAQDTLDALQGLLDEDVGVHDLLLTAAGDVFLGSDAGRRPSATHIEATSVQAFVALLAEHADEGAADSPAFTARVGAVAWTVVRAPLARDIAVLGRCCPRRRLPLGDFVDRDLMSSDIARRLVETVREGRNLLVSAPDHAVALRVLDALVPLSSPGQLAFFLGDARSFDTVGTSVSVIDRAGLDALPPAASHAVRDMVRGARWVFLERLSSARDLEWWFGGEAFARGRVAAMGANSARGALTQLQALHASLHLGQGASPLPAGELVDSVLFVEHLRPGRGQTFTLEDLGDTDAAGLATRRPASMTAIAAVVSDPEPADAVARPVARHIERPGSSGASDPAELEVPAAAVHRRGRSSQSSPRVERPVSSEDAPREYARTGAAPRVEKPDTAAIDFSGNNLDEVVPVVTAPSPEPDAAPAAVTAPVGFDDFSDFGDLFSDDSAALSVDSAPASPGLGGPGGDELFGPGELDDVLGVDDEPDTSSAPAHRRASSSPRHPANPHATSGSRYNADTTRNDADSIRASRYRPDPNAASRSNEPRRPRSNDLARNVRRATPAPIPAVNASAPAASQSPAVGPTAPSSSDWRSRPSQNPTSGSGGAARPLVGRGAATRRRVNRPQSSSEVLSSADIEYIEEEGQAPSHGLPRPGARPGYGADANNAFMQEGTLDDDVVGDFASEPTRRAEWPKDG